MQEFSGVHRLKEKEKKHEEKCVYCSFVGRIGIGNCTAGPGGGDFTASAQQKTETAEVKIDNFSFGPGR